MANSNIDVIRVHGTPGALSSNLRNGMFGFDTTNNRLAVKRLADGVMVYFDNISSGGFLKADGTVDPTGNFDWNSQNLVSVDELQAANLTITDFAQFLGGLSITDTSAISFSDVGGTKGARLFYDNSNHLNIVNKKTTGGGDVIIEASSTNDVILRGDGGDRLIVNRNEALFFSGDGGKRIEFFPDCDEGDNNSFRFGGFVTGGSYRELAIGITTTDNEVDFWGLNTYHFHGNIEADNISQSGANDQVAIDNAATAGYLGAANNDGVLRTGTSIDYTDGGDFVTLDAIQDIRTSATPQFAQLGLGVGSPAALLEAKDGNIYLSDSDVAHGLTSLVPTDVFGAAQISGATQGGLQILGVSDTDYKALELSGVIGSTNPTDTIPAISFLASKSDGGTGNDALSSTETAFGFDPDADGTYELVILGNGYLGLNVQDPAVLLEAKDGEIYLSDSDVSQPATGIVPADVYGRIGTLSGTAGGLLIRGLSDTDASAYQVIGVIGTINPTDSTPCISFVATKSDGGISVDPLAATETAFAIDANADGTYEINVRGNGDLVLSEDLIIGDGKYIGSASDPDAIQIEADGDIVFTQELYLKDDKKIYFGTGSDAYMEFDSGNDELLLKNSTTTTGIKLETISTGDITLDSARHLTLEANNDFLIRPTANGSVETFKNAASGETEQFAIWGFKAGDAARRFAFGISTVTDNTTEFYGTNTYQFNSVVRSTSVNTDNIYNTPTLQDGAYVATGKKIYFGDTGKLIQRAGSDLQISDADGNGDVEFESNGGFIKVSLASTGLFDIQHDSGTVMDCRETQINSWQNHAFDKFIEFSVSNPTASTTQSQGQQVLTATWNYVFTNNDNDVVTMPTGVDGRVVGIANDGPSELQVFPANGDFIYGEATNDPIYLLAEETWYGYYNSNEGGWIPALI